MYSNEEGSFNFNNANIFSPDSPSPAFGTPVMSGRSTPMGFRRRRPSLTPYNRDILHSLPDIAGTNISGGSGSGSGSGGGGYSSSNNKDIDDKDYEVIRRLFQMRSARSSPQTPVFKPHPQQKSSTTSPSTTNITSPSQLVKQSMSPAPTYTPHPHRRSHLGNKKSSSSAPSSPFTSQTKSDGDSDGNGEGNSNDNDDGGSSSYSNK
ncbi:hypothetical protein SAMD00019534_028450 [Acytostelium subglobosum LB1]|uniref:hypothetical protein n=1 Tax=Acytostelium subglobosum LB1 TaxID=1410327 RepID=UPI0006447C11|nr:hypothetical protein SAMD00019534_028450 [Acytostelium subglobosum LB1]GAM19670.1 hypothetical protein SAMD00019534_028450 [Acytostelium subglobosum LB1]|eukprot:XP_012756432.1 hypothetical protein SAMD00019534_028450 [Acytostelium subglobosum LB1]